MKHEELTPAQTLKFRDLKFDEQNLDHQIKRNHYVQDNGVKTYSAY